MEFCVFCGGSIPKERQERHSKFCGNLCRDREYKKRYYHYKSSHMPTGTVGAISELKVVVDLLSKGYEVFRSLSPNCSCDLAILQNHKLFRVEVKTSYITDSGSFPHSKGKSKNYDILAIVADTKIVYQPSLSEFQG